MTKIRSHDHSGLISLAITLLILAFWVIPTAAVVKNENKETSAREHDYDGGGFDAHAFPTAEKMMDVAPFLSSSPEMYATIRAIYIIGVTSSLKVGDSVRANIDDEIVRQKILDANPYRRHTEVQEVIENLARYDAGVISENREHASDELLQAANELYKQGYLEKASGSYRRILTAYPGDRKARNNLALAQMHLGNDLLALLHWKILAYAKPEYVPALINLSVLYCRMGLVDKSRNLSRTLAQTNGRVPMAAYNEAWFLTGEKKFDQALALLSTVEMASVPERYKKFGNLIRKMKKALSFKKALQKVKSADSSHVRDKKKSLWREGLAGRLGGKSSIIGRTVAVVAFLVLAFLSMGISAGLGGAVVPSGKSAAGCLTFLIVGPLTYILFWGIPSGFWGWGLLVGFLVACGSLTATTADTA